MGQNGFHIDISGMNFAFRQYEEWLPCTHSSHFLRINIMAISKQVVVSHVEASVLIKIPKFPECVKFYLKKTQNWIHYKKQTSQTNLEVSASQLALVSSNKNDQPIPILYVEKEREKEWELFLG